MKKLFILELEGLEALKKKGLTDLDGVFGRLFYLFFKFHDLTLRKQLFLTLLEHVNVRLLYRIEEEKKVLNSLKKTCDKFIRLFENFNLEKIVHVNLVKLNNPELVKDIKKNDAKKAESKRIVFTKQHGFVQITTHEKPFTIKVKRANTFKPRSNIIEANKLIILGDGRKYILKLDKDELCYTQGKPILFCGNVIINDGKMTYLKYISDRYTMTHRQVLLTLKHLEKKGVPINSIEHKVDIIKKEEIACTDKAERYLGFCETLKRWIISANWQRQNDLYNFITEQENLIKKLIENEEDVEQTLKEFEAPFNNELANFKDFCLLTENQKQALEKILKIPPWKEIVFKLDDRQIYMNLITYLKKWLEGVDNSDEKTAFFKFLEGQHNSFDNPKVNIYHSKNMFNNALPQQLQLFKACCSKKACDELNGILEDQHPDQKVLPRERFGKSFL